MSLILEVVEGDRIGTRYKIRPGVRIGRRDVEIILRDQKVSKLHATFQHGPKGEMLLIDNNSSNALKTEDGKRVRTLHIQPGIRFAIGKTTFLVIDSAQETDSTPLPNAEKWQNTLLKLTEDLVSSHRVDPMVAVSPYPQLVKLSVMTGMQLHTEWYLGYGTRSVGAKSLECPIFSADAPDECFRIEVENNKVFFITEQKGYVSINGESLEQKELQHNDVIKFGSNQIKVEMIDAKNNT